MNRAHLSLTIHSIAADIAAGVHQARPGSTVLDDAFATLQSAATLDEHRDAERRIWQLWCTHDEPAGETMMREVLETMAAGHYPESEALCDRMVERWPDWAEAWNRRATLRFLRGDDSGSVRDIERTLSLESRHFGALGGFAQIAARHGDVHATRVALEKILTVAPAMPGISGALAGASGNAPH